MVEEGISELEDMTVEDSKTEMQREKDWKKKTTQNCGTVKKGETYA